MTISQLILRIRKDGGQVWLDELARLNAEGVSETQMKELSETHDLVVALLREEIAGKRWESRGKKPRWWRVPEQTWTYPEQLPKPLPEIVRIWLTNHCVGAARCTSSPRVLHREFCAWAGFERDAAAEPEFVQQLVALGFPLHKGMVEGICLPEDFNASMEYGNERRQDREIESHHGDERNVAICTYD